jgi:hypothetical protein
LAFGEVDDGPAPLAAFVLTESILLWALSFVSYAWLAAIISRLAALRWNGNLPALSLLISNLAAIETLLIEWTEKR